MKEDHFRQVADFLHQAVTIALALQATSGNELALACWLVCLLSVCLFVSVCVSACLSTCLFVYLLFVYELKCLVDYVLQYSMLHYHSPLALMHQVLGVLLCAIRYSVTICPSHKSVYSTFYGFKSFRTC